MQDMLTLLKRVAELSEEIGAWEYQVETELTELYDTDEVEKCKADHKQAQEERDMLMHIIEDHQEFRVCDECQAIMQEGYCIEAGSEYYCGDTCLHKHYTKDEWLEMYNDGDSESYWTHWY